MIQTYTSELKNKFNYLATWLPNVRLKLGDVGIVHRDQFEYVTTLDELQIPFTTRESDQSIDLEYQSRSCILVEPRGEATDAGFGSIHRVRLNFNRANSVLFLTQGARSRFIEDRASIGESVKRLYAASRWEKDYAVITELIEADTTTILIARESGAHIELEANAGIGGKLIRLADMSLGLAVQNTFGLGLQIIGNSRLTPLFRASGLKRRFWGEPKFRSPGQRNPKELEFVDVDYDA